MTPAQLKAALGALPKRTLRAVQRHGRGNWSIWQSDGDDTEVEVARSLKPELATAIVATMNAADALVALWEEAEGVGPLDENGNSSVHHPDDAKPFNAALRRLEELKP